MVTPKKGIDRRLIVKLTPAQKALIREGTGKVMESLNLEGCQDRLIMDHLKNQGGDEQRASQYLILELTSEQRERLRVLTGKTFSEVRIRRRSVAAH